MSKKTLATIILALTIFSSIAFQNYARRIFPTFTDPATPCIRGSVYYHMINNTFLICTNEGIEEVAVGSSGGVIPIANATTTGRLLNTDWIIFNNKQNALGFTPENLANKNASNGYAGLSSGKITNSQMSEVISSVDLSDYSSTSGSGTTAIKSTISGAATNDVLTWNGSNWINSPISAGVSSVFGRTGIVTAQTGDYTAVQVTNAFSTIISNTLTLVSAPLNPPAGFLSIWADSTDAIIKVKDSSGTTSLMIKPNTCSGTDKVSSVTSAGLIICSADQEGAAGSGITTLNTLNVTTQTFSDVDDTNVTLAINSSGSNHAFTLGWAGTLADSRVADILSLTQIPNQTSNGFIKTSGGSGTLTIDTNTYLTSIANNSINGAMIAMGSDAQGDILYYNGTDYARLPAGTSGQFLQTQGSSANPVWATVSGGGGGGDMFLANVQTVTGAKTFDPAKLIVGGVSSDPSVVIGGFYRDLDDNKLYWGVDSTTDFWGEIFVAGLSGPIDVTKGGTGIISYTKGDILAASNSTTLVKVGVGSDGLCLKADSAQTSGLIWGTCAAGGGITTLNTLTTATQTFADVDDTNVTLAISSSTSTHTFTLGWTGILAKARQHAETLYTDDIQTITAAKTFDPAKLIIASVSTPPSVVVGSFFVDSDDKKLYWGVDDPTTDFWGEVFIAGHSLINLTSNVTGILPKANGGTGGTFIPYDISTQIDAKPSVSLQVLRYVAVRSINLSDSGHRCSAVTAATAQTDFVVAVNGTSKGTLRFTASGTTCTIVSGSTHSIVAGDILTITAPASQDATLADIAFTLNVTF